MKTSEDRKQVRKESEAKNENKKSTIKGTLLVTILLLVLLPLNVMAARERFVLSFGDSHITGHSGKSATLFLRNSLKQQYPWVDMTNISLRNVVLVAKSQMGKGRAQLKVGDWATPLFVIDGHPRTFRDLNKHSFDRARFRNPSNTSKGPWQIDLQGNFIVRKVVLEVEDHRPRYSYRWRGNNW